MTGVSGPDIAGFVGVGIMALAYAGASLGKLDAASPPALVANIVGAALVLISLAYAPNLPATVMESFWLLMAALGLIRAGLRRRP